MGNCVSQFRKQQKKVKLTEIRNLNDTKCDNSIRTFTVHFINLKVKSVPTNGCSIHVDFDKQHQYVTIFQEQQNPFWTINDEFEFNVEDKHLKTESFVTFRVLNKEGDELGFLKINLYLVAIGPYHHDIEFFWHDEKKLPGRLQFDLKISQKINLTLHTQSVSCTLKEGLKESAYNFTLRLLSPNQEFTSNHSENLIHMRQSNQNSLNFNSMTLSRGNSTKSKENPIKKSVSKKNNLAEKIEKYKLADENFEKEEIRETETSINMKQLIYISHEQRNKFFSNISEQEEKPQQYSHIQLNEEVKQNIYQEQHYIEWNYDLLNYLNSVDLEANLNSRDIHASSIQLSIWGIEISNQNLSLSKKISMNDDLNIFQSKKVVGQCYISVDRLIQSGETQLVENDYFEMIQKIVVKFEDEKLWHHGIQVGTASFSLVISHNTYLRQMIVGVMTESGVQKSSPSVYAAGAQNDQSDVLKNYQQNRLNNQQQPMINQMTWFLRFIPKNSIKMYYNNIKKKLQQKQKMEESARQKMSELIEIINKKHKTSNLSFYYGTTNELMKAQNLMIQICKHIIEFLDEVDDCLKSQYYVALRILINRGELSLCQIGFGDEYADLIDKNAQSYILTNKQDYKLFKIKTETGLEFQKLIYLILKLVLSKLTYKAPIENEKEFIENFLAMAYFIIPEFRQKLLECLVREDDPVITEWRGYGRNLDQITSQINQIKKNNQIFHLFDWHECLYKFLYTTPIGEQSRDQMILDVYEPYDVIKTIELVNAWISSFQENKKQLPTNFDYEMFMKMITMILIQDHNICLQQILLLIYNNFSLFSGNTFYKLFCHWSKCVRILFYHLLIYRIHHRHKNQMTELKTLQDLYSQIAATNSSKGNKFKNSSEAKFHLINDIINMSFYKVTEILEQINNKMQIQHKLEKKMGQMSITQRMRLKIEKFKNHEFNIQDQEKKSIIKEAIKIVDSGINKTLTISTNQLENKILQDINTVLNENINIQQNSDKLGDKIIKNKKPVKPTKQNHGSVVVSNYQQKSSENSMSQNLNFDNYSLHENRSQAQSKNKHEYQKILYQKKQDQNCISSEIIVRQRNDSQVYKRGESQEYKKGEENKQQIDPIKIDDLKPILDKGKLFMAKSEESQDIFEIEQAYLKNFINSYSDYQKIMKQYLQWFIQHRYKNQNISEQEILIQMKEWPVPNMEIAASEDEGEADIKDEW